MIVVLGFNDTSTLVGHFVCLPAKARKEVEEMVEEIKEGDREERGTGMKVKTEEIKPLPLYPYLLHVQG